LIANAGKLWLGGVHKNHLYIKLYTKRVDALCMSYDYQPSKFEQFDGNGNPKYHVGHFIETCNNANIDDDQW